MKHLVKRTYSKLSNLWLSLMAAGTVFFLTTVPAMASTPTIDDVWAAASLDGIQAKVIAILVAIIGIKLLFVAGSYIASALRRARG